MELVYAGGLTQILLLLNQEYSVVKSRVRSKNVTRVIGKIYAWV